MRVSGKIRKAVVYIGRWQEDHFTGQPQEGEFVPYGTGFLTITKADDKWRRGWQTIVTAKHVLNLIHSETVCIRLNNRDGKARLIRTLKNNWVSHADSKIDVSVYPIHLPREQYDILHMPLDHRVVTPDLLGEDGINVGDEVYFGGMFIARMGEQKNIPILRFGTIAALVEEKIKTEFGFHHAFLIEARSIDGISGSPVCVYLPPEKQPVDTPAGEDPHFVMGMVLGYQAVFNPFDLIEIEELSSKLDQQGEKPRWAAIQQNTGIAVVLPIWHIIEAVEQDEIKARRAAGLATVERFVTRRPGWYSMAYQVIRRTLRFLRVVRPQR